MHCMSTISLQKKYIDKSGGVVVLPLEEYERLLEHATPTFYLSGREAISLDAEVKRALQAHKSGKTKIIQSLANIT